MTNRRPGRLGRFLGKEDGSATIEFIIFLPFFLGLFLATFEVGMLLTRHVLLDRAMDLAMRDVRLGNIDPVTHDALVNSVCAGIAVMPDCQDDLRLEMATLDPRDLILIPAGADCVDRGDPEKPLRSPFDQLDGNQLTIVRACALFNPIFPTTGIGASIHKESDGAYALVATASFVVEPN